ncbi:MAG: hypothetical protein AAGF84_06515 [Planctomycetota bacterium]
MKYAFPVLTLVCFSIGFTPSSTAQELEPIPLLHHGDFDGPDILGNGEQLWKLHNTAKIVKEGGNQYLRVAREGDQLSQAETWVSVDPSKHKKVMVSARMRTADIVPGDQDWQTARIVAYFEFAEPGKKRYIASPTLRTDSDWVEVSTYAAVPEGATRLRVLPGIYGPAGTLDVDDLRVVANPSLEHIVYRKGFPEGGFESARPDGTPDGWPNLPKGASRQQHDYGSGHFIRFDTAGVEAAPLMSQAVKVGEDWSSVTFSARFRVNELQRGPENWHTPRLQIVFLDSKGERVGNWPQVPSVSEANPQWVKREVELDVPVGAE